MSTTELEMKIRELRQLQQLIEEAQAEAEGIRDVIKAHMGEREELRAIRTQLEALLGEKAERLKELGGTGGTRLAELDRALDALAAQRREGGEARRWNGICRASR